MSTIRSYSATTKDETSPYFLGCSVWSCQTKHDFFSTSCRQNVIFICMACRTRQNVWLFIFPCNIQTITTLLLSKNNVRHHHVVNKPLRIYVYILYIYTYIYIYMYMCIYISLRHPDVDEWQPRPNFYRRTTSKWKYNADVILIHGNKVQCLWTPNLSNTSFLENIIKSIAPTIRLDGHTTPCLFTTWSGR